MDGDGTTATAEEERPKEEEQEEVSLQANVEEPVGGGNDSGVDVTPAVSCDSSLASGCYDPCKSPVGPFSPTGGGGGGGPSSLPWCYYPIATQSGGGGGFGSSSSSTSRPSTPTRRRPKLPSSMSSSFHFETSSRGRGNSPPPPSGTEPKKTDLNAVAKQSKISTVKKLVNAYDVVKSSDGYAAAACTFPRRRRKSKENLAATSSSSSSSLNATTSVVVLTPPKTTAAPSLNRAASLRRKHIERGAQSATASSLSPVVKPVLPSRATRPSPPAVAVKTKIYHEVCSQTCLTSEDITSVLLGNVLPSIENRVETNDAEVQVDFVEKRIGVLETELKEKTELLDCKTKEFNKQQECLKKLQEQLNHVDLDACRQIDAYSLRLCNLFQINDCIDPSPSNILEILEKQVSATSSTINEQQKELNHFKTLCTSLHKDLEKSYAAQKSLLQANQAYEMESIEIQDFLQAEKSMLSDTIKELEKEVKDNKEQLTAKEKEVSKIMEQCTHLVRISEQRRQENLSLQAKMQVMENRSRELLQQQETTASSAVVGLSGLGNRLDSLLEKLVKSYSISEVDIEDEVYFNEAYTNGEDSSSDSEQRNGSTKKSGSKSLMSAIVSAIKSAPTSWQKGKIDKNYPAKTNPQESPCSPKPSYPIKRLQTSESMKELKRTFSPVWKQTGSTGDLFSQTDSLDDCSDMQSAESESLNNLSEAIIARQQSELSVNSTSPRNDDFEFLEDFRAPDTDLLDQVIDLDNTVTKLLKVITIVQLNGKEQSIHQERHEIKCTKGKNKQYNSQSPLIHNNDDSSFKLSPLVPMQELNTNSPKALNGIM